VGLVVIRVLGPPRSNGCFSNGIVVGGGGSAGNGIQHTITVDGRFDDNDVAMGGGVVPPIYSLEARNILMDKEEVLDMMPNDIGRPKDEEVVDMMPNGIGHPKDEEVVKTAVSIICLYLCIVFNYAFISTIFCHSTFIQIIRRATPTELTIRNGFKKGMFYSHHACTNDGCLNAVCPLGHMCKCSLHTKLGPVLSAFCFDVLSNGNRAKSCINKTARNEKLGCIFLQESSGFLYFPFRSPVFDRNLNFRSAVILFFGTNRSKNLRSKTKAAG